MKRLAWCALLAILMGSPVPAQQPPEPRDVWLSHLGGAGFLLMRLSSINMIQGLRLTPDQARQLLPLAEEVASHSVVPPILPGESSLASVVATMRRVESALLAGRPIPDSFRQLLFTEREKEATVIREHLRYDTSAPIASCIRCHVAPGERRRGWPWWDIVARHPGIIQEKSAAHIVGPFGRAGFQRVASLADRIDGVLNDIQRAMVASFSCCILPPRDLVDPVRIGQAQVGDWEIPALEKVRSLSAIWVPLARHRARTLLERRLRAIKPGVLSSEVQALREKTDGIIDRARAMSDVDFAIQKQALAAELTALAPPAIKPEHQRLMRAVFLMIPGAADLYRPLAAGNAVQPAAGPSGPPEASSSGSLAR